MPRVYELIKNGKTVTVDSSTEIIKIIGLSRKDITYVANYAKSGNPYNGYKIVYRNDLYKCSCCGEVKNRYMFYSRKKSKDDNKRYPIGKCSDCYRIYAYNANKKSKMKKGEYGLKPRIEKLEKALHEMCTKCTDYHVCGGTGMYCSGKNYIKRTINELDKKIGSVEDE